MFQAILISVLAATAVAFTNVQRAVRSSSVLKMGFENEIGAQPPLGFWDPLGLLKDADEARFKRLREVETKHGRIAMVICTTYCLCCLSNSCNSLACYSWTPAGVRNPYGDKCLYDTICACSF